MSSKLVLCQRDSNCKIEGSYKEWMCGSMGVACTAIQWK